ncbi:MAG: hypothetical protein J6P74_07465 [Paludibacteraceae bacterium]|nr:hypothetical protein [Paludibacteraceae bacterium]
MKKSSEYRSAGFQLWREHVKESSLIMLVQIIGYFIAIAVNYIITLNFPSEGMRDQLWLFGATLFNLCTTGLLAYYVPVWFLMLRRNQPLLHTDVQTGYGRALITSAAVTLPSLVWQVWNVLKAGGAEEVLGKHLLFVLLLLTTMVIVWPFAVGITLPFRAFDHPQSSVSYLVKTNLEMMKGYKMKLFWVSFKVWVWPFVIILFTAFIAFCVWVYGVTDIANSMGLKRGWINEDFYREQVFSRAFRQHGFSYIVSAFAVLAECFACLLIISPINYFAHISFFEDWLDERGGDILDSEVLPPVNSDDAPSTAPASVDS